MGFSHLVLHNFFFLVSKCNIKSYSWHLQYLRAIFGHIFLMMNVCRILYIDFIFVIFASKITNLNFFWGINLQQVWNFISKWENPQYFLNTDDTQCWSVFLIEICIKSVYYWVCTLKVKMVTLWQVVLESYWYKLLELTGNSNTYLRG